jgi:hypothetical protein
MKKSATIDLGKAVVESLAEEPLITAQNMTSLVVQMVEKKLADHSKAAQKAALKEALKTARKNCSGEGTTARPSPRQPSNGGKQKPTSRRPSPSRLNQPKRIKPENTSEELRHHFNRQKNPYKAGKPTTTTSPSGQLTDRNRASGRGRTRGGASSGRCRGRGPR